jgi:uncharacterized protein (TIGR00369 family)
MTMTAAELQSVIRAGVPMAEDIGFCVEQADGGRVRTSITYSDRLVRPGGTLSGAVQMALADASMYAAVMSAIGQVEMAVTSNLSINFLQKPAATDLAAEAVVLRQGSRLIYCEVRVLSGVNGEEQLVAHATGSYALPHKRN